MKKSTLAVFFMVFFMGFTFAQPEFKMEIDVYADCAQDGFVPDDHRNVVYLEEGEYILSAVAGGFNFTGYEDGTCSWVFSATPILMSTGERKRFMGKLRNPNCPTGAYENMHDAFRSAEGRSMSFRVPEGGDFVFIGVVDSACDDNYGREIVRITPACAKIPGTNECNERPVAVDKEKYVNAGQSRHINLGSMDYDLNGNLYYGSVAIMEGPRHGTVSEVAYGTTTYTPDPGFVGIDTIVYEICDDMGFCDEGRMTIIVE